MKFFLRLFLLLSLVFIISGCQPAKKATISPKAATVSPQEVTQPDKATIVFDFGKNKIATFSAINAQTVWQALDKVGQKNNWEIKTKKYSFGLLVTAINGQENNQNKAWMFYVNGQLADKAADKFGLKNNDLVEWKYEKPKF